MAESLYTLPAASIRLKPPFGGQVLLCCGLGGSIPTIGICFEFSWFMKTRLFIQTFIRSRAFPEQKTNSVWEFLCTAIEQLRNQLLVSTKLVGIAYVKTTLHFANPCRGVTIGEAMERGVGILLKRVVN